MPLTLASRLGRDTLGKMELAARRRYAEARRLEKDEPLGAIYLFGYTVEMLLKAAYYRVVGLVPSSEILGPRRAAEASIRTLLNLNPNTPIGHNLYGWATLLEQTRANTPGIAVLPVKLATKMYAHVQNIEACWTEVLRYRAIKPYDEELQAV